MTEVGVIIYLGIPKTCSPPSLFPFPFLSVILGAFYRRFSYGINSCNYGINNIQLTQVVQKSCHGIRKRCTISLL